MRECGWNRDIDGNHLEVSRERTASELTIEHGACVVYQHVHGDATTLNECEHAFSGARASEIASEYRGLDAVLAFELLR